MVSSSSTRVKSTFLLLKQLALEQNVAVGHLGCRQISISVHGKRNAKIQAFVITLWNCLTAAQSPDSYGPAQSTNRIFEFAHLRGFVGLQVLQALLAVASLGRKEPNEGERFRRQARSHQRSDRSARAGHRHLRANKGDR